MSVTVIPTKIIVPKRPSGIVHRPRLIDFLHENLERKLMLVTAPAGYGKTTLLIDFASDVDLPVCWLTLDEGDRDLSTFLTYLVASIRQKFADFGRRSLPLAEHGVPSARAAAAALVADISDDVPEYFVLVLDDWHFVNDEAAIRDLVDHLLRYLPEQAHVIVAGRTLLRGPLIRLAAQGAVAGIGPNDLRFKPDEVREVLASRYNLSITPEQATRLADEAEGWITAILLTSPSLWQNLLAGLVHMRDLSGTLYEYLAGEVFDRLEPPLRRFLLVSSVPNQFTAALCDELRTLDDSALWIEQAEARNLFLIRIEVDGDRWYHFHHLFRDFLLSRLKHDDPAEFVRLQLRAGDLFARRQQPEEAIEHYLAAHTLDRAVQLMDANARRLFISGRRQTLHRWVEALPSEFRVSAPDLILYEGQALIERGQLTQALPMLLDAQAGFHAHAQVAGEIRAILPQGWVAYAFGKYQDALRVGQSVLQQLEAAELSEQVSRAEALRLIGDSYLGLGQLQTAEDYLAQALVIYRHTESDDRHAYSLGRALQDLAHVLRTAGRLEEAATLQAESLTRWRQIGNPGPLARCLNNMGYDRYVVGDYEGALQLYAEALTKAEEAEDRHVTGQVLEGIATAHRDRGEFQQAIEIYNQLFGLANDIGDQALVCWALEGLGRTYRLSDELDRALALFEQAYRMAEREELRWQADLLTASIGIAKVEQGAVAEGQAHLDRAASALRDANSYLELAHVLLWLARAHHLNNQLDLARNDLAEIVRLGSRLGCRPFAMAEGRRALSFLAWGGEQLPTDQRLRSWLDEVRLEAPTPIVTAPQPMVTPHIEVHGFGVGMVSCDGRVLTSTDWGRSALARELFFFMLERAPQRRDEMGVIFWPDVPPGRMISSFHAVKYRVQRALGVEFVIYEDECYRVNPEADIWYDVAEFRRLIESARLRSNGDPERITEWQEAVALYSANYLVDIYSEWTNEPRRVLQPLYFEALCQLIDALLSERQFDAALELGLSGLEFDSYREDLHRTIMLCLAETGRTNEALRHYEYVVKHLETDLHIRPEPETTALAVRIRATR